MSSRPGYFVEPFAADFFGRAARQADELARRPALGKISIYEIVAQVAGPHAEIKIGRRPDGTLWALKGFRLGKRITAAWEAMRESEALRMIQFGFGGLLPIEETLGLSSVDNRDYLCMPYCQGGSLRDRVTAGGLSMAELAYHGLALAVAMRRLHSHDVMHGDIKPENVLFALMADELIGESVPRWQTWLSDLETVCVIGGSTSWRATPDYAAPEQLAGADAAPAMDIWAWGATLRYGMSGIPDDRGAWKWLTTLIGEAMGKNPAGRPTAGELIEAYGRHIGFGDHQSPFLGAMDSGVSAWYPIASLPAPDLDWPSAASRPAFSVKLSLGWAGWLAECQRLHQLNTIPALRRMDDLSSRVLGDPRDPDSLWQALRNDRQATSLQVNGDAAVRIALRADAERPEVAPDAIPRPAVLKFVHMLVMSLVERVEITGDPADLGRLGVIADTWESIGEFGSDSAAVLLAQALLLVDEPERALTYIMRAHTAAPDQLSVLGTLRLYHLVTGDRGQAAEVAWQMAEQGEHQANRIHALTLASGDLLAAGEYAELDGLLTRLADLRIDVLYLIGLILAGRLGAADPEPGWPPLREHFATIRSDTSIEKLRYIVEAAFQCGDTEYASRRADIARTRPAIRLAFNHQARAAVEAVALGRDPANVRLTRRLNNRSELWSADGRPADPLTRLCFLAAQRWITGAGRTEVSAETRTLVEYTRATQGGPAARLLGSTRRCVTCANADHVANLSLCGHCHRLFCADCVSRTVIDSICGCGGDVTHPTFEQWEGLT